MPGTIERNISNLHDQDTGKMTGYVNPVTNKPEALDAAAVQALVSGAGIPWAGHASAEGNAGAVQKFSDIGTGGSLFVSDGTYWRPLGGSVCLLNRVGSPASPVASITSVGAALLFGAPLAGIRIPAGLLIPGQSMIQIDGYWSKRGSTSGANCTTFLGTTNSLSDSQFSGQSIGAAATAVWRQRTEIFAHASTSFTNANHTVTVNGVAGAVTTSSPNVNINTAADMFINFGSTNAVSGDGHDILRMTISVFQ